MEMGFYEDLLTKKIKESYIFICTWLRLSDIQQS